MVGGCCPTDEPTVSSASIPVRFVQQDSEAPGRVNCKAGTIIDVMGTFTEFEAADGSWQRHFLATGYRVVPAEELENEADDDNDGY